LNDESSSRSAYAHLLERLCEIFQCANDTIEINGFVSIYRVTAAASAENHWQINNSGVQLGRNLGIAGEIRENLQHSTVHVEEQPERGS
jgi:hypothetical protein